MATSVFLLGPGFLGGAILALLKLERPQLALSVLVRKPEQAEVLRSIGAQPVLGSLDDADLLQAQAAKSDIIINTSSNKHLASVQSLAAGVKARGSLSYPVVYIHTSGNGVLTTGDHGVPTAEDGDAYNDSDAKLEKRIPPTAPHRSVDIAVADLFAPLARVAIVSPPLIYGVSRRGPFDEHRLSVQIPALIKAAHEVGEPLVVGRGTGVWSVIHVDDLASSYLAVLAHLESSRKLGAPDGKIYFLPETGAVRFDNLSGAIGETLKALGAIGATHVRTATDDEQASFFGPPAVAFQFWADNALAVSVRLPALGWQKSADRPSVLASIYDEVNEWLRRNTGANT